ncbi:MAG: cytochrome c3 family protein [Deltaproteobacteria bacterium]|jgi:hypothetical protein
MMNRGREKLVAYAAGIILTVVGVVCYAAFPYRMPEQPVRIMFKSTAGNVLFNHKMHTSEQGYGYGCMECHHTLEDVSERPLACGECHEPDSGEVKRSDAFHKECQGCHDDSGMGPVECSGCHVL